MDRHDPHRGGIDCHRRHHHRFRHYGAGAGRRARGLDGAEFPGPAARRLRHHHPDLFVGLAMIESTAIYCFVVSMILIFANPFWNHVIAQAGGK
jgi:hypothetical protein